MAKKSKTQRAKASAKRAEKKEMQALGEQSSQSEVVEVEEPKSRLPFKRSQASSTASAKTEEKPQPKKEAKPAKKRGFFKEVRSELKRVTWPTRQDVLRWTGVVVVALIFFSVFVFVLDNWVVTPLLVAISSLGA